MDWAAEGGVSVNLYCKPGMTLDFHIIDMKRHKYLDCSYQPTRCDDSSEPQGNLNQVYASLRNVF